MSSTLASTDLNILLDHAESYFIVHNYKQSLIIAFDILQSIMNLKEKEKKILPLNWDYFNNGSNIKSSNSSNNSIDSKLKCIEKPTFTYISNENKVTKEDTRAALKIVIASYKLPPTGLIDHYCTDTCICQPTVILIIQILYELNLHTELEYIVNKFYPLIRLCPYSIFSIYIDYLVYCNRSIDICNNINIYIQKNLSESLLRVLTDVQRENLIILLIKTYISLQQFKNAKNILETFNNCMSSENMKMLTSLVNSSYQEIQNAKPEKVITPTPSTLSVIETGLNVYLKQLERFWYMHNAKIVTSAVSLFVFIRLYYWLKSPEKSYIKTQIASLWKLAFANSFGRHISN